MNDSQISGRNAVAAVADHAAQVFSATGSSPYSPRAFTVLNQHVESYISELIEESAKIARRHQADAISAAHVEQAASYLVSSARNRVVRHLGTVGGILLGAGLSTILSLVTSQSISPTGFMVASGFSIIGAFLVAIHIAKE